MNADRIHNHHTPKFGNQCKGKATSIVNAGYNNSGEHAVSIRFHKFSFKKINQKKKKTKKNLKNTKFKIKKKN